MQMNQKNIFGPWQVALTQKSLDQTRRSQCLVDMSTTEQLIRDK